jgi:O-succinylbenzoic acid--CoA ligase
LFCANSGSTGKPKQIVLQKAAMIALAKATGSFHSATKTHSFIMLLSADHIAGK